MTTHLTVGFDGSACATTAVGWAAAEAWRQGWDLEIVNALDPQHSPHTFGGVELDRATINKLKRYSRALLNSAEVHAHAAAPSLTITSRTVLGTPVAVLAEAADTAAVLVVGRQGLGAFRGLLGSVGTKIATQATCPVVVIPEQTVDHAGQRIVVGVDDSAGGTAALRYALDRAGRPRDTRSTMAVTIVAAYDVANPSLAIDRRMISELDRDERSRTEQRVGDQLREATTSSNGHVAVEIAVVRGAPADCIVSGSSDASMIVVGSHGRGLIRRALLGSVSRAVLHQARCPVAVIPVNAMVIQPFTNASDAVDPA